MGLNRRRFLQLGSAGLLLPSTTLASLSSSDSFYVGPLPILQGATDETSTQMSILHKRESSYDFVATSGNQNILPTSRREYGFEGNDWVITKIYFSGLELGREYELLVHSGDYVLDRRSFRLLDTNQTRAKIAVCSCMHDLLHHNAIWDKLWQSEPDVIFFAGDTVYADFDGGSWKSADPKRLWRRHVETRRTLFGFRQRKLIPILAVWDDHDFGSNNSNREFPHREKAKEIFEGFFAQDANLCTALTEGPGVSRRFSAFGQEFNFIDGRTYRSPDLSDEEALFGVELSNWLYDGLAQSQKPSWMISGSQFFGKYRAKDGFEHLYHEQFRAFTDKLKELGGTYGFISGDVHFSEVLRIEKEFLGYEALEVTSSSMHSLTVPYQHHRFRNPRRLAATSRHNFVLLELEAGLEDVKIGISSQRAQSEAFRTSYHLRT